MPEPSKYDPVCTMARDQCKADGVILIVLNGEHGNGFACQLPENVIASIPSVLRECADQIEQWVAPT